FTSLHFNTTATTEIYTLSLHDALPISMPKITSGIAMSEEDFTKTLNKIAKHRENDFGKLDPKKILEGKPVFEEFKVLLEEAKKRDRKSTRLNSSHDQISYAVFCLKKKK